MSDSSVVSPITPIRNTSRFTPSPPQHTSLPVPVQPQSTPFFTVRTPSPIIDHNSPAFINFSPRPILGVQDIPPDFQSNLQSQPQEDDVSGLLSSLRLDNTNQSALLQTQAESIAKLKVQALSDKKSIATLKTEVQNVKNVFHGEFQKIDLQNQAAIAHLRGVINGINDALKGRIDSIDANVSRASEKVKVFVEPPHDPHICFTGLPRETNNFCFDLRNSFERIGDQFITEKQKILWITGYFRSPSGRAGDVVASYTWWRGLLSKNAAVQGLDPLKALARMDYVIDELKTSDAFIHSIETTFTNHHALQEAEAAFHAAKQGNKTIEEFNVIFNALLYSVDLADRSKCIAYEKAIDPNIIKLALLRGPWTDISSLEEMQSIAVSVSKNVSGVSKILDPRGQPKHIQHQPRLDNRTSQQNTTHSQHQHWPQTKLPDGDPMDLDEVAMKEMGFTYADFRRECVDRNLCIQCGGPFNDEHQRIRGCALGKNVKMDLGEMLDLWREWGGAVHKKRSGSRRSESMWAPESSRSRRVDSSSAYRQSSPSSSPLPNRPDKGKKRASLAEVDGLPFKKRETAEDQSRDSGFVAEAIGLDEMSAGEMFFMNRIAEMGLDDS